MIYLPLQEGPAQTGGYFVAGFLVIFGMMAVYLLSLYIRKRKLTRDLQELKRLETNTEEAAPEN